MQIRVGCREPAYSSRRPPVTDCQPADPSSVAARSVKPSNRQDRSVVIGDSLGEEIVNDARKKIINRRSLDRGRLAQPLHAGVKGFVSSLNESVGVGNQRRVRCNRNRHRLICWRSNPEWNTDRYFDEFALFAVEKQGRKMTRICHRDFAPIIVDEADENSCKVPIRADIDLFRSHLENSRRTVAK